MFQPCGVTSEPSEKKFWTEMAAVCTFTYNWLCLGKMFSEILMRGQYQWPTSTAGTMKRSLRLKDSISFMSSSEREKSNTCKFCWILEGVTLLGMHTTPLCTCHLPEEHQKAAVKEVRSVWLCATYLADYTWAYELCLSYLNMIWAGVFWYLWAMVPSWGSCSRVGSSGEAQGLSPLPRGL